MFVDTTTARLLCYARGSLTSPQLARATRLCSHLAVRTSAPPPTVPDLARLAHKETPSLPVLLSLAGSSVFRDITRSPYRSVHVTPLLPRGLTLACCRQSLFVFTAIETLRKEGLAGLDLAWEVPRGTEDRGKLSSLLKELREAFDAEGAATGRGRLLLTAAVPATLTAGFDVLAVSSHVDMLTVDAFDLHGGWEQQAAHHSPLFPLFGADSVQRRLTTTRCIILSHKCDSCITASIRISKCKDDQTDTPKVLQSCGVVQEYVVKEWLSRGTPPQKLLVGLPTFGRSFTLANTSLTDVGAPAEGGGLPGRSTGEKGLLAFSEVCLPHFLLTHLTPIWRSTITERHLTLSYKYNAC
ncbi:Cht7 [Cordylochernes scorpioides]|uniref:Cht7 n=1 Tax=Cordylochernes scorpioides TaxID=51811 RepID=A0ABY6L8F0_9ARAC|nr:Cht7 [Cordylochernes scorpioides]